MQYCVDGDGDGDGDGNGGATYDDDDTYDSVGTRLCSWS